MPALIRLTGVFSGLFCVAFSCFLSYFTCISQKLWEEVIANSTMETQEEGEGFCSCAIKDMGLSQYTRYSQKQGIFKSITVTDALPSIPYGLFLDVPQSIVWSQAFQKRLNLEFVVGSVPGPRV